MAVTTKDAMKLLRNVPLFSGSTERELAAVANAAKLVAHGEGDVLAREGERGIGFFLICEGTARVSVGGKTRATLGPGDFFGEISLLDEGPRSATVTATSPVTVLGLTAWTFKGLVERHPSIALRMLEMVAARLRRASTAATL